MFKMFCDGKIQVNGKCDKCGHMTTRLTGVCGCPKLTKYNVNEGSSIKCMLEIVKKNRIGVIERTLMHITTLHFELSNTTQDNVKCNYMKKIEECRETIIHLVKEQFNVES